MEASEINRRVAVLLGWSSRFNYSTEIWWLLDPEGHSVGNSNDGDLAWCHAPDYCADPAASDLVEQEMRRRGVMYEMKYFPPDPTTNYLGEQGCSWKINPWGNWIGTSEWAETTRIALCLAFLAADIASKKQGSDEK